MPQIFQVLRCYKCLVFQINQTKKSNKWECKLCGEKQSVKRHYGIGNGKECRLHVQRLNVLRGEKDENEILENNSGEGSENDAEVQYTSKRKGLLAQNKSKWSDYVETNEEPKDLPTDSAAIMYLGEDEVVLDIPKRRKQNACKKERIIVPISNTYERSKLSKIDFHSNVACNAHMQSISSEIICDTDAANICIDEPKLVNKMESKSQIIHPISNRNSKWAQYADEQPTTGTQTSLLYDSTKITPRDMFSLCEDGDLDNVLDI